MQISYDPEADALWIQFADDPPPRAYANELDGQRIVHRSQDDDSLIAIEILFVRAQGLDLAGLPEEAAIRAALGALQLAAPV